MLNERTTNQFDQEILFIYLFIHVILQFFMPEFSGIKIVRKH